jgi:hypothetical protein
MMASIDFTSSTRACGQSTCSLLSPGCPDGIGFFDGWLVVGCSCAGLSFGDCLESWSSGNGPERAQATSAASMMFMESSRSEKGSIRITLVQMPCPIHMSRRPAFFRMEQRALPTIGNHHTSDSQSWEV